MFVYVPVCVRVWGEGRGRGDSLNEAFYFKLILKYAAYSPDSVSWLSFLHAGATVAKIDSHKISLCKPAFRFTPDGLGVHCFSEIYLGDSLNVPQKDSLQQEKRQTANKLMKNMFHSYMDQRNGKAVSTTMKYSSLLSN